MFRKTVFWLHLACGVIAGIVIAIMSFTGAALSFEKELIAFAERDARHVTPPSADAKPLPLDELLQRVRQAQPNLRLTGVVITNNPRTALALNANGRPNGIPLYANPYTAEVREPQAPRTRAFMRTMRSWHMTLTFQGERRAIGAAITGACNAAFLVLACSGLYLWWPRSWTPAALRAVLVPSLRSSGKARDFNWHNSFGVWSAPVLIVLTATALPMSYRWANNALFRLAGSEPPAAGGGGRGAPAAPAPRIQPPNEGAQPLTYEALTVQVRNAYPEWAQLTIRVNNPTSGAGAVAQTVTVREATSWPRTATTTLWLDPYTGSTLKRDGFAEQNAGRRARTWNRFLHTGEALGWPGQLVAGLACLAGVLLSYTGFALAWRRFVPRRTAS